MKHSHEIKEAIILAGGLGTRLRSILSDVPKPMAMINNKPFLEYLLDYWKNEGITKFVISVGYKHRVIINHFGNSYKDIKIEYVIEEQQLGTGGAFLKSMKYIQSKDYFILLNGDTFFEINLNTLIKFHNQKNSIMTLALFNSDDHARYKTVALDSDSKIINNSYNGIKQFVNGGVYIINKNIINQIVLKETIFSFEEKIIDQLIKDNKNIYGFFFKNRFIDIGEMNIRNNEIQN